MDGEEIVLFIIIILIVAALIVVLAVSVTREQVLQCLYDICFSQSECAQGYACQVNFEIDESGVCKAGANTSCSQDRDCLMNYSCQDGFCWSDVIRPVFKRDQTQKQTPAPIPVPIQAQRPVQTTSQVTIQQDQKILMPLDRNLVKSSHYTGIPKAEVLSASSTNETSAKTGCSAEFDALSQPSTMHSSDTVSTPFYKTASGYMARAPTQKKGSMPVSDVCSFSNAILALLSDGNIIKEFPDGNGGTERVRIQSHPVKLERLEPFGGYIYGVSNGKLYKLDSSTYSTKKWKWVECQWAPFGIIHTSSSLNDKNLWLQTSNHGYLYNSDLEQRESVPISGKLRVYGTDNLTFIEFDPNNCSGVVMPVGVKYSNMCGGALTYHGDVISIRPDQRKLYSGIRLINWVPYYIRK